MMLPGPWRIEDFEDLSWHDIHVHGIRFKGLFVNPEGWPEKSPIWNSSLEAYRVVGLCHGHLTPRYRQLVADAASTKRVHHLRSPAEMRSFLETVKQAHWPA